MESHINTITYLKFIYYTKKIENFCKTVLTIIVCLSLNIFAITPTAAKNIPILDEQQISKLLKFSDFGNAITTGTKLKILYQMNKKIIAYYINIGPETGHQNDGIIIFSEHKYQHNYYMNFSSNCKVSYRDLICRSNDFPKIVERVSLVDLFAGKELLIGGSIERPWHGSRQIYR
jgi:hypothetical protein